LPALPPSNFSTRLRSAKVVLAALCGRPLAGQYDRAASGPPDGRERSSAWHTKPQLLVRRRAASARRFVGALLAPTPPERRGAQSGATAPRDSAAGAQPRAGPPASAGGTSMASTHPLPRSSTVAQVLSAVGIDGLRTMLLHCLLNQLLTITVRRPCWSPAWCGACSDRASRSVPTCVGKLRSVAPLCPACVAVLAAGHHGCALACQAPFCRACSGHETATGIAWAVLTTTFPITLFSACRRSRRARARPLPAAPARHATAAATAGARPFAW
jgi:hypothetical protein